MDINSERKAFEAAREAISVAVCRITEVQKRDGGKLWHEAKSVMFNDIQFIAQGLIDALAATGQARTALSQPQELPPLPSGYAYEYPGPYGGIQFTNGETRNGSEPIRAIPYYFAAPPSIAPLTDEQFSAIVDRASDECDAWSDSQDGEPTINETKAYFARRIIAQVRGEK